MLKTLDHVNIRTSEWETLAAWYEEVLGMKRGWRPPFPFPGAWLYVGESPYVHLVAVETQPGVSQVTLEHFAFSATGLADFVSRLDARGERYERTPVPGTDIVQINLWDPEGNHLHVDFVGEA